MGGSNSKREQQGLLRLWRALRKAPVVRYGMLADPLIGQSSNIQEECDKNWNGGSTRRGKSTPEGRKLAADDTWDDWEPEEEEVGFPVRPRVPLRQMTYKLAVDFSHFLKEKGGLEGIYWSPKREQILNLYALNEWGIIDDWQAYSPGPGTRKPRCFGFCFELVPVDVSQEAQDERHCLLHPAQIEWESDPWKETLVWKFNPLLAVQYNPDSFKDMHGLVKRK
ncbi:nef protein [Simian immunodeficiency virus - agm.tan-1]|uniref:Protein Nef n=1 Tax=Simian immunodeficiency virus AGM.tantalus TaxID=349692 RepID=P89910_SIVTA|nr:nef protein [Simian immunodeficiency virus - agm.tan-1]